MSHTVRDYPGVEVICGIAAEAEGLITLMYLHLLAAIHQTQGDGVIPGDGRDRHVYLDGAKVRVSTRRPSQRLIKARTPYAIVRRDEESTHDAP